MRLGERACTALSSDVLFKPLKARPGSFDYDVTHLPKIIVWIESLSSRTNSVSQEEIASTLPSPIVSSRWISYMFVRIPRKCPHTPKCLPSLFHGSERKKKEKEEFDVGDFWQARVNLKTNSGLLVAEIQELNPRSSRIVLYSVAIDL